MRAVGEPDVRTAVSVVRELETAASTAAAVALALDRVRALVGADLATWSTTGEAAPDARDAHRIRLRVPVPNDPSAAIVLRRERPPFDEGERALLELLRPSLADAIRSVAGRELLAAVRLTRREREVLSRVAAGDANAAIARRLGMRPRTVDKHLEHVYAKLGVASRTAAAARLREITH
ncbi:MAG TPA: LuxR C-terminal-related transcriptional regulator [Capillimicrobium sp.]|nr:LuxR C-terminal-related transcriptional regulator [Capillimicrobium sp.]